MKKILQKIKICIKKLFKELDKKQDILKKDDFRY